MTNVERFKQLEKQILWIQKELKKGEYMAAGLSVDVCIGQSDEENYKSFSFGVYSGIEKELLELILRGLEETKGYVKKDIQKEYETLKDFIENNG